jgi:RNA polymerase sigma-70 factor (ECF subfamily)
MDPYSQDPVPRDVEKWLREARAGSMEALGKALQACRGYLLALANRELESRLRPKMGASDLVQESFLEAQRDFRHFRGVSEAEFLHWLREILCHNLLDLREYFQAERRRIDAEVSVEDSHSTSVPKRDIVDEMPSPSGEVVRQEEAEALERALSRLSEKYQKVIAWRHQENRSHKEVGEFLNISADAARQLYRRAVAMLARELNDDKGRCARER